MVGLSLSVIFGYVWPFVGMFVTGYIGWYFSKKRTPNESKNEFINNLKSEAEAESINIRNVSDLLNVQRQEYTNMLTMKDGRLNELMILTEKLSIKIEELEVKVDNLTEIVNKQAEELKEKERTIKMHVKALKLAKQCKNSDGGESCLVSKELERMTVDRD
jgi:hypothetical protein